MQRRKRIIKSIDLLCRDLFSKKCMASGSALAVDTGTQHLVPPLLLPYRLTDDELRLAASPSAVNAAFHMHSAPHDVL